MKHLFLAAAAALALAACSDTGPLQSAAGSDPRYGAVWDASDSIFTTQVPESTLAASPGWQVGTVFTVDDTVLVTHFRYYKAVGETGSHMAKLYTSGGTLVGSAAFFNETASGWQRTAVSPTFRLAPGTYVVTVNTNTYQVKSGGYFAFNGWIYRNHLVATGGKYGQPTGSFPSSNSSSAFFVDLVYRPMLCNTDYDFPCP